MKVIYLWTSQPWMNRSSWMELVRRRCQLWLLICGVLIRQGFIATIESKHAEQRRRKRSRNKAPSIKTLQALLDQKKKVCFIIKSRSCFAGNSSLVCNCCHAPVKQAVSFSTLCPSGLGCCCSLEAASRPEHGRPIHNVCIQAETTHVGTRQAPARLKTQNCPLASGAFAYSFFVLPLLRAQHNTNASELGQGRRPWRPAR